jgi:signal transduction histidine kinase
MRDHNVMSHGPVHQMVTRDTSSPLNNAFLSWLNHELRSPLNACVMWLDVLALSPQPDKLAQAVETIKRNLARQARLVNDLNDAGKVSSGGLEMRLGPLDVVTLLKRNLDAWQLLARGRQVAFHPAIELATAPVDGDSDRLAQAVNHLVESAIASTAGGGRVSLRVSAANGHCVVEVEDTGAALSAEDLTNLGTPLWRAPTTLRARAGLGLGVAVAHHIAEKHGGSLTATSSAAGVRFTLTVPLAARGTDTVQVTQASRTPGS